MKVVHSVIWIWLLLGSIGLVVIAEMAAPDARHYIMKEGGPVEVASALGYFLAAALLSWQALRCDPARWSLALLVACTGLRELDLHKRFSTMSIFKSRFYLSAEVPGHEKLIGVLISIALIACLFFIVKRYFRGFIEGLKQNEALSWSVFGIFALLVFTKSIDGLGRKLKPLGIELGDVFRRAADSIEEVLELAAAIMIIVVALTAFRRSDSGSSAQRSK